MLRLIDLREFWLRETHCHAAAVRPLIRQQEFRSVEDIVRCKQFVEVQLREVQRVMSLQPCPQLRRNLKPVNELISLRRRVLPFHFLHDVRIALGEDVKRELAHGFRPRRCRRDARDEFDRASIALRLRTTHKNKCAQRHTHTENSCFSHVKIVTELQNQKAELPAPYPEPINQRSPLELQTAYPPLALFLRSLGEPFYLLGFLDHVDGEHFSRRGFLDFFAH